VRRRRRPSRAVAFAPAAAQPLASPFAPAAAPGAALVGPGAAAGGDSEGSGGGGGGGGEQDVMVLVVVALCSLLRGCQLLESKVGHAPAGLFRGSLHRQGTALLDRMHSVP
jgi:hypothetical protein